jgi:hypothetical protein
MDAKSLREAMKEKAKRLSGATSEKVDASTFTPAEPLNASVKTGMRPVSRRAFKVGGKVAGAEAMTHAGRTPRKSGGKTEYANALVNRNVKDANEERDGIKHVGGMKNGGRTAKQNGGDMTSSMRPMPRPSREMMDEMGITSSTRPMPRPSGQAMKDMLDAAEYKKYQGMMDRAARSGDGHKHGGKAEGSAKDMMEDKKMAAKAGMTMKEWEASHADKMHDMPSKKMSGGKMGYAAGGKMKMVEKDGKKVPFFAADGVGKMANGGGLYANIHAKRERIEDGSKEKMRKPGAKGAPSASDFKDAAKTAKSYGGGMDGDDEPKKGPYQIIHQKTGKVVGKANTLNGARKSRERNDMNYGSYAHQIIDTATGKATMKDGGRTSKMGGGGMQMMSPAMRMMKDPKSMSPAATLMGMKKGGKAMHHADCMCKACGGAAMAQEGGRTARKSGGKVGKSNISINIYPHTAEKAGAMPVPPAGMPPMGAPPMPRPPMPAPMPSPVPSAPPPAHMSLPPGLQQALAGATGTAPMPPAGGQPMPPMMGRKAGGRVEYPITGGAGGGKARKEKIAAYGEKMNKDLKK